MDRMERPQATRLMARKNSEDGNDAAALASAVSRQLCRSAYERYANIDKPTATRQNEMFEATKTHS